MNERTMVPITRGDVSIKIAAVAYSAVRSRSQAHLEPASDAAPLRTSWFTRASHTTTSGVGPDHAAGYTANIDELGFLLDGRADLAPHVQAIGATVTNLIVAMSAEECQRQMNLSGRAPDRAQDHRPRRDRVSV